MEHQHSVARAPNVDDQALTRDRAEASRRTAICSERYRLGWPSWVGGTDGRWGMGLDSVGWCTAWHSRFTNKSGRFANVPLEQTAVEELPKVTATMYPDRWHHVLHQSDLYFSSHEKSSPLKLIHHQVRACQMSWPPRPCGPWHRWHVACPPCTSADMISSGMG